MSDVGAVEIAAGALGTMTVGTFCFLLLQILKAFVPGIHGAAAEVMVLMVSGFAMVLVLTGAHADWLDTDTWLSWVVGTLSATVVARGVFAQLFRVDGDVRARDARGRFRKSG